MATEVTEVVPEPKDYVVRLRVTESELGFLRRVAQVEERSVSSVLRLALRQFAESRDENGGAA